MTVDFHNPSSTLGQTWVRTVRAIYHPLGFHKGYNFPLFLITCGAMMGFVLARVEYFNIDGIFLKKAIPGEQYWYAKSRGTYQRVGIILHIVTILPAVFLVCFQFVPVIRYKAILFHRINGYAIIILFLCANAGAFMIFRHAAGGELQTQTFIGILGTITTGGMALAYINIKRLQIDQHRAWMLRTWSWAASIISLRLILLAANKVVIHWYKSYHVAMQCAEIFFMYSWYTKLPDSKNPTPLLYPQCKTPNSTTYVAVGVVNPNSPRVGPENSAALARLNFGVAGFVALTIHAILVELYLGLTPAESARLRQVSYERQLKAGYRNPQKGALTATRLGDAPEGWNSGSTDILDEKNSALLPATAAARPGAIDAHHPVDSSDDDMTRQKISSGTHAV